MGQTQVLRAYRIALDPTAEQRQALASHAGAARAAYNYHLAALRDAHRRWAQAVAAATYQEHADLSPEDALTAAKKTVNRTRECRFPSAATSIKAFFDDPSKQWRTEVNRYAISTGMRDADAAWQNWISSLNGQRAGRRVGYPRFHAKGRSRDSFTLYHDVKSPTLRPEGYRRLVVPAKLSGSRGGSIRLHGNIRQLARRITQGTAHIRSVTFTRGGKHWYASILALETVPLPEGPNRTQRGHGPVGVDVGVHHLAALSTGEIIPNPRHLTKAKARLTRAQRHLARTGWWLLDAHGNTIGFSRSTPRRGVPKRPTSGRLRAQAKVTRLQAELAERRATTLHTLTKQLATRHSLVAIEDLNVAGMTASAKGTLEEPGRNVSAKAGLNRAILDAGFGEIRRQLTYKTTWYGSTLRTSTRFAPTSKTCSSCGAVKVKLSLKERVFTCSCGHRMDRDINAAINIRSLATQVHHDAPGNGESLNADGATHTPPGSGSRDFGRPGPTTGTGHPSPGTGWPSPPVHTGKPSRGS